MATAKQACQILDSVLRLPDGVARCHADLLRARGCLPSTQGVPAQISPNHIAIVLLSLLVGSTTQAPEYAAARSLTGRRLSDALGGFIERPHDFFELRVCQMQPHAVLTYRGEDRGMRVETFDSDHSGTVPAFSRLAVLGASTITHLATAIAAAPPVRAGRRRTAERFRRT